ncbi:hypothetical protein [Kitasatospora cineracea]|uniref:hypothetical protein n=1 Tax=Kitasatospora cineracea TaxID=88074 RepID=UPI003697C901
MSTYEALHQRYTTSTPTEISPETLASIHELDLATLVPLAAGWPTDWQRCAEVVLHLAGPAIRGLVAEVVVLDQELHVAEAELEKARGAEAVATAVLQTVTATLEQLTRPEPDGTPSMRSALAAALRFVAALDPAPSSVEVRTYHPEPEISITGSAADLVAWATALGAGVEEHPRDRGAVQLLVTAAAAGIPVRMAAYRSAPRALAGGAA